MRYRTKTALKVTGFTVLAIIMGIMFWVGNILYNIYDYYEAMFGHSASVEESIFRDRFVTRLDLRPNPLPWNRNDIFINEAWIEKYSDYYTIVMSVRNDNMDLTVAGGRPWFRLKGESAAFALTGSDGPDLDLYTYLLLEDLGSDSLQLLVVDIDDQPALETENPDYTQPNNISLKDLYFRMLNGLEIDTSEVIEKRNNNQGRGNATPSPEKFYLVKN